MNKPLFITGTDTEIGKTFVTERLIRFLRGQSYNCLGIKPIASDSREGVLKSDKHPTYSGLINADAKALFEANDEVLSYSAVNPIIFADPIAPHIAAEKENKLLSIASLNDKVVIPDADMVLIEGAGGWHTPLNQAELYSDWVRDKNCDVILVVGMKLGCLNHAQLTAAAIRASGLTLKGWVANELAPDMSFFEQNIEWLQHYLFAQYQAPLLAKVDYQQPQSEFNLLHDL